MEINYELKTEDFYQFHKENAPTESTHKPMVILFSTLYLTFILADVLYVLLTGWENWNLTMLLLSILIRSIIYFISIFVVLGILKQITKKKLDDISNKQGQNGSFCEHRIILTENALVELTDVNTSRYAWKSIGEIKETESFLMIEVLMSSSYIIPKRYFQDRKQINEFLAAARQYQQNAEYNFQLSHFIEYEKGLE